MHKRPFLPSAALSDLLAHAARDAYKLQRSDVYDDLVIAMRGRGDLSVPGHAFAAASVAGRRLQEQVENLVADYIARAGRLRIPVGQVGTGVSALLIGHLPVYADFLAEQIISQRFLSKGENVGQPQ